MKLLGPNSRRCDFKEKLNLFSGRHQTMSVKSRFHPRNIYKNPPNFKELAIEYPDFRKYVKQELCGRFSIDYQDQGAVKELTRTLLKRDFNLDVEIDDSRLVPRIPLCLNYILWIEDLLNVLPPEESKSGIDIGTGNVCIYSLLAARRGWKMLATEIDPYNFKSATNNIIKNDLFDTISLKMVPDSNHLLIAVLDANSKYDFCMCNPPFFDYREKPINRTLRRAQLKQVASNVQSETCTEGGEVSFITKLMKESVQLKEQIKIFTTLVGKKCDFLYLKKELQKIHPKSTAFTEFCQGRTTRWGIAWTFLDISLKNVGQTAEKKSKRKMKSALQFEIPANKFCDPNEVFDSLKRALNDLEVRISINFIIKML